MPELQIEATVKSLSYTTPVHVPIVPGTENAKPSKKKKDEVMEVRLEDEKGHSYIFELNAKEVPPKLGSTAMIKVVMEYADAEEYVKKDNPGKSKNSDDEEGEY